MSVSVLRNNRESRNGGAGSQLQLAVTAGCGAACDMPAAAPGGAGNTLVSGNPMPVSSSSPPLQSRAVTASTVAVASGENRGPISSRSANNDNNNNNNGGKPERREAVVEKDAQHQQHQVFARCSHVTGNFKNGASAPIVRGRGAYAPKSAGIFAYASTSSNVQPSTYHARRRVHSFSEDDCTVGRLDNFPKRPRFSTKPSNFHHYKPQNASFSVNPNNGGKRRADTRFPKRVRVNPLLNQPPAPNNTTQFLITDHEEREHSDREFASDGGELAENSGPAPVDAQVSTTSDEASANRRRSTDANESEEDFIEDPEFAAVCDDYNLERIMALSREEVNREMLETQKDNLHLNERVEILRADNQRLREMLRERGVDDVGAPACVNVFPLRRSASPDGGVVESTSAEDVNDVPLITEEIESNDPINSNNIVYV